jgi:hypothetical protein
MYRKNYFIVSDFVVCFFPSDFKTPLFAAFDYSFDSIYRIMEVGIVLESYTVIRDKSRNEIGRVDGLFSDPKLKKL